MKIPKILIVTSLDIYEDNSSSSMTIRSFFENIPSTNIYQLICINTNDLKHGRIGYNKFCLNRSDILFYPSIKSKGKNSLLVQPIDGKISNKKSSLKHGINVFLRDTLSILPYKNLRDLISYIRAEKIDLIYTCSFSPRSYTLINELSHKTGVKHVCHFFDDWPNIAYSDSKCSKFYKHLFNKKLKSFIHESPFSLCISELMCKEYKQRYGYDLFYPLMHSVDQVEPRLIESNKKIITYAGSLYLERYKTISEFCRCIKRSGKECDFEIVVYTHQAQWDDVKSIFSDFPFIRYGGFITHEELMQKIQESYALLFVESMKKEMLEYTRLSMSTKIPEFLSSGKPIFAIGNSDQGSISYLKDHNAAFVVDDIELLDEKFASFENTELRETILRNASDLFQKNHVKAEQQKLFLKLIQNNIK